MKVRQFLLLMGIVTLVSWAGFLSVIFFVNPETTGKLGIFLFYLSLFFSLTGTFSLVGYLFRMLFTRHFAQFQSVQIAFRQAAFFGIVITVSLFLQSQQMLSWLNALLLVFLLTAVEFLIISLRRN